MKKLIARIVDSDVCLLAVPFILWIFCFRYFFTGHLSLQADAVSYFDQINVYTNSLIKGVFPLWEPDWYSGAPSDFFLRRIGDVNPLLFLMVLFKWLGLSSTSAYLVFIGCYYFLAGWAMYLIGRFLWEGRFLAFTAYIVFLFSSWGSEVFYNYIIIIFVPIIWFFYFLLCFSRRPRRSSFLGMCFCVAVVVTTYIPFLFLTILAFFAFFYALFYPKTLAAFLTNALHFFRKHIVFAFLCGAFLLVSCLPGLLFYKESKSGEFVLPGRHAGSEASSAVAVGMGNIAGGDLINHGYFDRIFSDQSHIDMGDIYLPLVFFVLLLTTVCARSTKLIFLLLFNLLALSMITITSGGGFYRFLYAHLIIFKFIRQVYYFFWLGILPMGILLSVEAFRSLLAAIDASRRKTSWLAYIAVCYLLFAVFLMTCRGVLWGAWAALLISLVYFAVYIRWPKAASYKAGFFLFLLAVFIQSVQLYGYLDAKLFKYQEQEKTYEQTHKDHKTVKLGLYYASHWFSVLVDYLDPAVLENYRMHKFIFYDNVVPYADNPAFLKAFQTTIASNSNIAYVSKFESSQSDWSGYPDSGSQADFDPEHAGELSVTYTNANTWVLKTHLAKARFLVVNDNYNSSWHASINGRPAKLLRANVAFKGVWVPAGDSVVVMHFSDFKHYAFHAALLIIFTGAFLCLLLLIKKETL